MLLWEAQHEGEPMNALAAVIVAVWGLGIIFVAVVFRSALRHERRMQDIADRNPTAVALVSAICVVFWPCVLFVFGLLHIAEGGQGKGRR